MKNNKIVKGIWCGVGIVVMFFLITAIVMWLWNGILPEIVGVKSITFWQAMGLLVLCKILFGGFKGKFGNGFKNRMIDQRMKTLNERMEHFTPEEKEKFKEKFKERFGSSFCKKD